MINFGKFENTVSRQFRKWYVRSRWSFRYIRVVVEIHLIGYVSFRFSKRKWVKMEILYFFFVITYRDFKAFCSDKSRISSILTETIEVWFSPWRRRHTVTLHRQYFIKIFQLEVGETRQFSFSVRITLEWKRQHMS